MIYIAIATSIFALDFCIKKQIDKKRKLGEVSSILKDRILIRKYYNKGAILDVLEKWPWLVRTFAGIILVILGGSFAILLRKKGNHGLKLGMSMVIGGGANNFYDRLKKGYVIDYFSFKSRWDKLQGIVFNISDIFIFLGTALMMLFGRSKR